jgi:Bacterial alpha-L-rhamnosidase 6 hairpin glycosidase domain
LGCVCWLTLATTLSAAQIDFKTGSYVVGLSRTTPAFTCFSVDSLGQGKLEPVPLVGDMTNAPALQFETPGPGRFAYFSRGMDGGSNAVWRITCHDKTITLRSDLTANGTPPPLVLAFEQKASHPTLLGLMQPGERRMDLPCVLHLPDKGSVRISCNVAGHRIDYDARRFVKTPFVRVEFPPASADHPRLEYTLEVVPLYPKLPGIETDPRFDGFRRSFLNMFQVNPRVQMLANNASSDPVPFTLYEYSEVALHAPPLADGLTCLDLVRMTLDRYLSGVKGYGLAGYGASPTEADLVAWKSPWNSLDSYPSLLMAACQYIQGANDLAWARANYDQLIAWARDMLQADRDGNGLIEYPGSGNSGDRPTSDRRPSNWWDTINFGHEDAYANALAYRACTLFAEVARKLAHRTDADFFVAKAAKLRSAYLRTFLNPDTGVLAGWKSADGQLHDYWFTFISGVAITYGLVDDPEAREIMDRLLRKMKQVSYSSFHLGLPGNLVPVRKADYVLHNWPGAREVGEPSLEDGSDAFQFYENGGATGCYAYFTIHALYQVGRAEEARRILYPMLASYAAGDFQGFCDTGKSKDWRDWKGGCHGYEGLLVDNYLALLAVFDERANTLE